MRQLKVADHMAAAVSGIPGGVGDGLALVAPGRPLHPVFDSGRRALPWWFAPSAASASRKSNRILRPLLELLATLAEAGLGFDAALARIQESESGGRALNREFQIYQRDTLGGIPRLEALRKLAQRIDVTSVSIFISALVQADHIGASLSDTLRTQADDLRDRRKLRALLLAQALPVKLVFPLIACFLPGIFFSTLGPVLSQLVDVVDSVIRRR